MSTTRASLALFLLLPACIGARFGNGVSATRTETFADASGFRLATLVDSTVTVAPGEQASVALTCDESLLDHFAIEQGGDGVIVLRDQAALGLVPRTDCFAEITVPALNSLEDSGSGRIDVPGGADGLANIDSSGSGSIDVGPVSASTVEIQHSGSGKVTVNDLSASSLICATSGSGRSSLTGSADTADILVTGSGGFGETGLTVGDLVLDVTGSGGAELTALDSADVTTSGSGGATIHGDPDSRQTHDSGSGGIHFE